MIELLQGDCLEVLREKSPGTYDVVVTSPPYNLKIKYGSYSDDLEEKAYLIWLRQVADTLYRVTTDDASFFLNLGYNPTDPTFPFRVLAHLEHPWKTQNVIHWIKAITIDEKGSWGHYKPVNSKRFLNQTHEYVFHLTKTGSSPLDRLSIGVPYQDMSNASRWGDKDHTLRCRGNCWFIPYPTIKNRDKQRPHPASFPPRLAEWCMRLHGSPKHVLDPFIGIGSTAIAANSLRVDCTGIDLDQRYLDEARRRFGC